MTRSVEVLPCGSVHLLPGTVVYKLVHKSTNTGLGSTTSAPRGGDIGDKEREVRAGRSQGSRPSSHARTKKEAK